MQIMRSPNNSSTSRHLSGIFQRGLNLLLYNKNSSKHYVPISVKPKAGDAGGGGGGGVVRQRTGI